MPRVPLLLCVLLIMASVGPVHASGGAEEVRISEVHPRPASDGREFIELWNQGDATVDLAGWELTDGINTFTFEDWTLAPGDRVVIWGGGNDGALGPTWKPNVWNNGGDTVTLYDAGGFIVDTMQYGTADVPVPDEGISLHGPGPWSNGPPTPGQDAGGSSGTATVTVEDSPPEVTWIEAPDHVRPGDDVAVTISIDEPNGDPVTWAATAGSDPVGNGTGTGSHTVNATAPATGPWTWQVTASSTDQQTTATLKIQITDGTFRVALPETGIRFTTLAPGASGVAANGTFSITNTGGSNAVPYIDMAPFRSADATIPVDGNLVLQLTQSDGTDATIPYEGPLQALPVIDAGDTIQVVLVIRDVPKPLPAGDYRSSFTVVA